MAFPTDDILLGPRSFGRLHRLDGVIWHTGEEPDFTRESAVRTRNWQLTNPGSYNFRIMDGGVMLNVPYLEASGGINPSSSSWAPEAWLQRDLPGRCHVPNCGGAFRNPTMHHLQVSFVGRTADLDSGKAPANYVTDARRLIEWMGDLPNRGPAPLVHSKHEDWQANRSDPGTRIWNELFGLPDTSMEEDMDWFSRVEHVEPFVMEIRPTAHRIAPDLTTGGVAQLDHPVERVIIGRVKGVDFGAGPDWWVYISEAVKGPKVVHSQDEISRRPLGDAECAAKLRTASETIATLKTKISAAVAALR